MVIREKGPSLEAVQRWNQGQFNLLRQVRISIREREDGSDWFFLGCVYALEDPRTDVVAYVGQTTDPKTRIVGICSQKYNPDLGKWTTELRQAGIIPRFRVLRIGHMGEIKRLESKFIKKFSRNACLLNKSENFFAVNRRGKRC